MYTRKGLGIYDISFLGRWKPSAVLRYIEDALEEMPLNRPRPADKAMVLNKVIEPVQVDPEESEPGKKRKSAGRGQEVKFESLRSTSPSCS